VEKFHSTLLIMSREAGPTKKRARVSSEEKNTGSLGETDTGKRIRQLELDLKLTTDRMLEVSEQLEALKEERSVLSAPPRKHDDVVVQELKQTVANLHKQLASKAEVPKS
jgi:hypothetical protein